MNHLRSEMRQVYGFDNIVGTAPPMIKIFEKILKVAKTHANVLIYGESGTGKELIARSIHANSKRRNFAFVPVDCVSIPQNLLESEFFGHERGSFTGAYSTKRGLLEIAHRGTFFLDEICELGLDLQAKLLRVLQERQFRRIGGKDLIKVNIRIISATNRNPEEAVKESLLREDLYYRLNVVPILLPPLRERREDISLLAKHFVNQFCKSNEMEVMEISKEAMRYLESYHWPGNVRELQNVIERVVSLASGKTIVPEDLPDAILQEGKLKLSFLPAGLPFKEARAKWVAKFERQFLMDLLSKCKGNISQVARIAKVNRMTIYRMMKNHGISAKDFIRN